MDQSQMKPSKSILTWMWIAIAVVFIGAGVWYFMSKDSSDTNTNISNANIANTNTSNTNTQTGLSQLQFSDLSLMYPSSWTAKTISGSADCRGFVSPELTAYNQSFSNTSGSGDAVITNDVTVCNEGALTGSLQVAAEKWIDARGADDVSPIQNNNPFSGAIRYTITTIRPFDVVFFEHGGDLIRATLEKLPYSPSLENQNKIIALLESVN